MTAWFAPPWSGPHKAPIPAATLVNMFALDEPTVGLHAQDVAQLAVVLGELAERGNAVVVIEHHPLLIASADRIVDLGPGGGAGGGCLLFDGSPEQMLLQSHASPLGSSNATARYLAEAMRGRSSCTVPSRVVVQHGGRKQ